MAEIWKTYTSRGIILLYHECRFMVNLIKYVYLSICYWWSNLHVNDKTKPVK